MLWIKDLGRYPMSKVRSVFIITSFSFGSIVISFFTQVFIAKIFGASNELDAFLAAYAIPQYFITVLMSSLGFILIPIFVEYQVSGNGLQLVRIVCNLINCCFPVLSIIILVAIIFAKKILLISAPGLNAASIELASKIFIIIAPTIVLSFINAILRAVYQIEKKFGWQAFAPFLGLLVSLLLLIFWGNVFGIMILAVSALLSAVLETFILLKILVRPLKYVLTFNLREPVLQKILKLLLPLIIIGLITKFSPLLDRYLASMLKEGSISLLNYAYQFAGVLVVLISTGIATVLFPQMALHKAENNVHLLKETIIENLKIIWVFIVPFITIGYSLALPVVILFLNRGEFTLTDSIIVASLLKIYLFGLIGMGLGAITGKIFYVLQDTKTLAVIGFFETVLYVVYTIYLTKLLGLYGIAIGYVIYFFLSISWHFLYIRYKIDLKFDRDILLYIIKTIFAGIMGGATSYFVILLTNSIIIKIILGGTSGVGIYILILVFLKSNELRTIYFSLIKKKNWTMSSSRNIE